MSKSEEALMTEVKNGDIDKASPLFDAYNKRLYNFFVKITFNRDLSHDLTQNVFVRMIKYRESYKEGKRFKSWIYQIARNVYADHFRKGKAKFSDFTDLDQVYNQAAEQLEDMEQREREKILYRSLTQLTDEQREILVLSRFQGMKYKEIAEITDNTVTNIKVKVHRAIKDLRDTYFELEKKIR